MTVGTYFNALSNANVNGEGLCRISRFRLAPASGSIALVWSSNNNGASKLPRHNNRVCMGPPAKYITSVQPPSALSSAQFVRRQSSFTVQ